MIEFVLDGRSGVSTYMQLVLQVKQALRVGLLRPATSCPGCGRSWPLAINPNTVLKAYRELEIEGLAEGRPGVGTFITRTLAGPSLPARSTCARTWSPGCARPRRPVWPVRTSELIDTTIARCSAPPTRDRGTSAA